LGVVRSYIVEIGKGFLSLRAFCCAEGVAISILGKKSVIAGMGKGF
jgi:hypothetical protein